VATIEATAADPRSASRLANAYAAEYIKFRGESIAADIRDARSRIKRQLEALPGGRASRFERRALRQELRELTIERAVSSAGVRQVTVAEPPTDPSAPKPARNTMIGLVIGLIIGFILALIRERLDVTVREPDRFEEAFDSPVIGKIPRSRALDKTPPGEALPPVDAQAFHNLRANLRVRQNGHGPAVVVTSAEAGEGKTTVAWNLACAAAGPGSRVLVIEADLRRPALSRRLGLGDRPGLSDVLKGSATLDQAIAQVPVASLENGNTPARTVDVLLAGSASGDPTGLLESERMREVLAVVAEEYELVVIDTPPTSVASDAVPLVVRVSGVIVVGRVARSREKAIMQLSKELRRLHAPTLGVVVNAAEVPRDTYRYYYGPRV
jgi:receptor protein-tyrosine kinase